MHSTRKVALFLTPLALAALGLAAPAAHAVMNVTYVVGSAGEFGTLDPTNGSYTSIGTLANFSGLVGIGFVNGVLYGLNTSTALGASGTDVYTIDPGSGLETYDGNISADGFMPLTATAGDGGFYALDTNQTSATLDMLDPVNLTATFINGNTGIDSDGLLVEHGGTLYAADINNAAGTGFDALDSVDPSSGVVTKSGDTGTADMFSLASGVSAGGTLYGFGSDGNVYSFDTSNDATFGTATPVGPYSLTVGGVATGDQIIESAEGPEASPAPEPSQYGMLALMGLGLGGLLLRARRQPKAE